MFSSQPLNHWTRVTNATRFLWTQDAVKSQNVIHAGMRMSRFHETLVQRSPRNDSVALTNEKLHRTFENNSSLKDSLCLTCDIFSCVRSSRSLWDFYFYDFFIQSSCCLLSLSWVSLILVLALSQPFSEHLSKHHNSGAQILGLVISVLVSPLSLRMVHSSPPRLASINM